MKKIITRKILYRDFHKCNSIFKFIMIWIPKNIFLIKTEIVSINKLFQLITLKKRIIFHFLMYFLM